MADIDLDELVAELADFDKPEKVGGRSAREERIIAGFEDIQRFVDEHGRAPQHGEERDIFERLYAVRLDRLRSLDECRTLLEPLDHQGLLKSVSVQNEASAIDDDELMAELAELDDAGGITELRHVRSSADKRAAEEIANRQPCADFKLFKPLFDQVQKELDAGRRQTRPFELKAEIEAGRFFVLGGQKAYVAEVGEPFTQEYGDKDARLRVIFDNGTESNMLLRSLQRALHKDEAGRRITEPDAGPLFAGRANEDEETSGTIYVLRSKSADPYIAANRDVVHKIGVTSGSVQKRIAHAADQPTYLFAEVDVVATYELYNLNRTKLENLLHRILDPGRLSVEIKDRFGRSVRPREWFVVPLPVIDEVVQRIRDGTISDYMYDPATASLTKRADPEVLTAG